MARPPASTPVSFHRRRFLAGAAGAIAAPTLIPATVLGAEGREPANSRIRVGMIGMGGQGQFHLGHLLGNPSVQVVAVCDPYRSKIDATRKKAEDRYAAEVGKGGYTGCIGTSDFRDVVSRGDLDVVWIASPEFWHALHAVGAMKAGLDVYCEKAMTLTHAEGRAVVETVRRLGRVYQLGTQQRSDRNFRHACELARNGYLGKVHTVHVSVPGGRALAVPKPAAPPADIDYEMWLGPAPWSPWNDQKCSFNWYFMYDYCIGWIGSWGVHHIDIAAWGCPSLARKKLQLEGKGEFPAEGLADTSVNWQVEAVSHDGVKLLYTDEKYREHGVRFIGDQGWVHVVRGGIRAEPASLLGVRLKPGEEHLYVSGNHYQNFLDCVRTRRDPVSPVEAGHVATTLTIVSDIATRVGRKVTWDWDAERFVGDDVANNMLRRPMRAPWSV
jgi:predicted dehydrogenase